MADEEKKILFVEWCAADALGGTLHLSPMSELAYRRIIDMIYETNDRLPDNDDVLQYSTKAGSKWKAIKRELIEVHKKIYIEDGFIRHERCTEKLAKSRKNITQKSDAAKAKHEKDKQLKNQGSLFAAAPADAHTAAHANQEPKNPITKEEEINNTHTSATTDRVGGVCDFSDFWKARPGRGTATDSEAEAKREFDKLADMGHATRRQLTDAMISYATQCRNDGKAGTRYAKAAANFLRDGTWRQYAGLQQDPDQPKAKTLEYGPLNDVQKRIQEVEPISPHDLHAWFGDARLQDGKLLVKTVFQRDWLRKHYERHVSKAFGLGTAIEFRGGKA